MWQARQARTMFTALVATLCAGLAVPAVGFAWSGETLPADIGSLDGITCLADSGGGHCLAVGQNASFSTAVVILSKNGGTSWHKVSVPTGVAALLDVSCPSATRCWAVGARDISGAHAVILGSTNGGSIWKRETVPELSAHTPTPYLQRISCVGDHCLATGLRVGAVLVTRNGGSTWSVHRLPQPCTGFCPAYVPDSVELASSSVGYAGGGNQCGGPKATHCPGMVWKTTDGGATWKILFKKTPFVDEISCVDSSHCWVASATFKTGEMYGTADGGKTWSHQTLPSFGGYFNSLDCVRASQDDCFAVGQNKAGTAPVIAATTDGGSKWKLQSAPSGTGALYGVTLLGGAARAVGQNSARTAGVALGS